MSSKPFEVKGIVGDAAKLLEEAGNRIKSEYPNEPPSKIRKFILEQFETVRRTEEFLTADLLLKKYKKFENI